MTTKYLSRWLLVIFALLLALAACGGAANTPAEPAGSPATLPEPTTPPPTVAPPTEPPPTEPLATEPPPAPTEPSPAAAPAVSLADELDAYLRAESDAGRFSGAALVLLNGEPVLNQGYGLADRAAGTPNAPDTRFPLGTLTMPFTALAVLQLQDEGKLDIAAPICDYLPDCPAGWGEVLVRHLLSQASGIPAADAKQYYDIAGGAAEPAAEAVQLLSQSQT